MGRRKGSCVRGQIQKTSTSSTKITRPKRPIERPSPLSNYAADAGKDSHTFATSDTWRSALLGTVAAGALIFGYSRTARADCSADGTTLNCSEIIAGDSTPGVVNGGILVDGTIFDTLNVNNLDADIAPDTGTNGINFYSNGSVTINSDTNPHDITTTDATGIFATSYNGNVIVNHDGDITATDGVAIYASTLNGDSVTVDSNGDLAVGAGEGIIATVIYGAGDAQITSDGTVT